MYVYYTPAKSENMHSNRTVIIKSIIVITTYCCIHQSDQDIKIFFFFFLKGESKVCILVNTELKF